MTKTALIADDDSATRGMLSRVLRLMDWFVIEVQDGGTAVERLQNQQVDLVILDLRMPQLSGLEVLNVIRGSADYADVPVVIITGATDQTTSNELFQLGITDFLVKPIKLDFARERLARIDRAASTTLRPRRSARRQFGDSKGVLMVVDADAEYRSFVSKVLTHKYRVIGASSAVVALRTAMVSPPEVFLIGPDVGLMAADFFARKIREQRGLAHARLVSVGLSSDAATSHFDAAMTRTFVPNEFTEQFDRVVGRSFTDESDELAEIRRTVESATEQAVGVMAATSVTSMRGEASDLAAGQMRASVDVQLPGDGVEFRIVLRATADDAGSIAAQVMNLPTPEPEDALNTLGELTNVVAGRITTAVTAKGRKASSSPPTTESEALEEESDDRDVIYLFKPVGELFTLALSLQLLPRRTRAAQPASEQHTQAESTA